MKHKRIITLLLVLAMLLGVLPVTAAAEITEDAAAAQSTATTIDVTDYGADPSGKTDSVRAVQKALEAAKEVEGAVVLSFPKGEYHFWPDYATKRDLYISNATHKGYDKNYARTIGILLEGQKDLTLEGNGSQFLFHGKMMSFAVIDSKNVTIRNLSYDFVRPAAIDMTVVKVGNNTAEIYLPDCYEYEIENSNELVFYGEKSYVTGERYWTLNKTTYQYAQVIDLTTGAMWRDGWLASGRILFGNCTRIEKIENDPQRLLLTYSQAPQVKAGYSVQVKELMRDNPTMLLWQSEGVTLQDINIQYMHSFGIVGQFSKDITVDHVTVAANDRKGTVTAASADMMQMSGCGGQITVKNCTFTVPSDDPINIHGTFLQITEVKEDQKTITVQYEHEETYGFPNYYVGDKIDLIDRSTLNTVATATVTKVENPPESSNDYETRRYITLTLDEEVPEAVRQSLNNYVVENTTYTPDVLIQNCVFDRSPVRGVLCTTRGKVVIEKNLFRNMNMSCIYVSDDANDWYESGYSRDVTIKDNVFELCNAAAILFEPTNEDPDKNNPVHQNLTIEGNTFLLKDISSSTNNKSAEAISLKSVGDVTIRKNTFLTVADEASAVLTASESTLAKDSTTTLDLRTTLPRHSTPVFYLQACKNVTIADNTYGAGVNKRVTLNNTDPDQVHDDGGEVSTSDNRYDDTVTTAYYSTNPDVATVTSNGTVTARSEGTAEVYAVVTTKGRTFESNRVTITVTGAGATEQPQDDLAITSDNDNDHLSGDDETLTLSVTGASEDEAVRWSATDPATGDASTVVSVEDGMVRPLSSGVAEVTATVGNRTASRLISVETGSSMLAEILSPVEGQIVSVAADEIVQAPSHKFGFFNSNYSDPSKYGPESLISFPISNGTDDYEATVKLTGTAVSEYEETGFGVWKDADNYAAVANKKHLGAILVTEKNGSGREIKPDGYGNDEKLELSNPVWLKIEKKENTYTGSYKTAEDGEWTKINEDTVELGNENLRLILWAASREGDSGGNYTWEDLTINGVPQPFLRANQGPTAAGSPSCGPIKARLPRAQR